MRSDTDFVAGQVSSIEDELPVKSRSEHSVLVVDDSPVARKAITKSLPPGLDVVEAESFLEATLFLSRRKFSLVITDVVLPNLSGISLLRAVVTSHPDTRVIVVTGEGLKKGGKDAFEEGAVCFLTKPFKPQELRRAVALALATRPSQKAAEDLPSFR